MSSLTSPGFIKAILLACLVSHATSQYKTTFFPDGDSASPTAEYSMEPNQCSSKQTCGECIRASPQCAWCTQPGNFTFNRCDTQYNLQERGCHSKHLYSPMPEFENVLDEPLANTTDKDNLEPIQMRPQRVALRIRPNYPHYFKAAFKQAKDYPVDLYYLMDLSKSMEDDKEKLAILGHELAEKMRTLTSNFRLGFGSFVDKVVMPYVSTVPEKLKEPCTMCAAPYGFKNHMSLSTSSEEFVRKVNETQISGNLDAPEGGFDAIMQAIVCKNDIGWREKSRKLLVFSTDAGFHYAGDGKLGGIVKPNDGECHLDNGMYTESITQDYPSISQINRKVQEHHVNIIFAVTSSQIHIYKQLTGNSNSSMSLIEGASSGELEQDSSNVVHLIENEYQKITSTIELKDNATSNIQITYATSCKSDGPKQQTNICSDLRVGDQVSFDITLEVKSCPTSLYERNQTIKIYPVGLTDALYIDLSMICDCECEQPWNQQPNSPECGLKGVYQCGICNCDNNHYGRRCECDAKESNQAEDASCYRGNDTKVCSGRGTCRCGECECFKRDLTEEITGQFCECDNFSCDRSEGQICAGNGKCVCGKCECNEGWSGSDCSCMKSEDGCLNPANGKICSGKGTCRCGQCECEENMTGPFCEVCLNCKEKCEIYKDCVQCKIHKSGPLSDDECRNCSFEPTGVEELEKEGGELCFVRDENDCTFHFKYQYSEDDKTVYVYAQNTKDCPEPVDFLAIVIGVIVGIVLIGIAFLLIWKLLTTIKDRREVAKFNEERMNAKWETGVNPIFKKATTTFKNPTYSGK